MTTYADLVLEDVPLLYLRLDETSGSVAADSSGNGRHGAYYAGALKGQTPLAWDGLGGSTYFDGGTNGQRVEVPYASWMDLPDRFTLECWVMFDGAQVGGQGQLIDRDGYPDEGARVYQFRGQNCELLPVFNFGDHPECHSPTSATPSVPHHFAATFDVALAAGGGSTTFSYIDGVKMGELYQPRSIPVDPTPLKVGVMGGPGVYGQNMHGWIGEVAVYDYALSPLRVAMHAGAIRAQPPLRQIQRGDPLGGGAPRVAGLGPTSRQFSTRQGWANTYV